MSGKLRNVLNWMIDVESVYERILWFFRDTESNDNVLRYPSVLYSKSILHRGEVLLFEYSDVIVLRKG